MGSAGGRLKGTQAEGPVHAEARRGLGNRTRSEETQTVRGCMARAGKAT